MKFSHYYSTNFMDLISALFDPNKNWTFEEKLNLSERILHAILLYHPFYRTSTSTKIILTIKSSFSTCSHMQWIHKGWTQHSESINEEATKQAVNSCCFRTEQKEDGWNITFLWSGCAVKVNPKELYYTERRL
jgi:hypothetical protein